MAYASHLYSNAESHAYEDEKPFAIQLHDSSGRWLFLQNSIYFAKYPQPSLRLRQHRHTCLHLPHEYQVRPRFAGKISKKARQESVSRTFLEGIVPATIPQKMHSLMV
jgi:hypothetical protein